jgi:hypothetical protein
MWPWGPITQSALQRKPIPKPNQNKPNHTCNLTSKTKNKENYTANQITPKHTETKPTTNKFKLEQTKFKINKPSHTK